MAKIHTIDELIDYSIKLENRVLVLPKQYKGCEIIIEPDLPNDSVFITSKENYEENKKHHLNNLEKPN